MKIKNLILGICAMALAVGSAFASLVSTASYSVYIDGDLVEVDGSGCLGDGSDNCQAEVRTADGSTLTITTLYTASGDDAIKTTSASGNTIVYTIS